MASIGVDGSKANYKCTLSIVLLADRNYFFPIWRYAMLTKHSNQTLNEVAVVLHWSFASDNERCCASSMWTCTNDSCVRSSINPNAFNKADECKLCERKL